MVECCAYVTGTEWLTGSSDGALALWSQLKKKPVAVVRGAHRAGPEALADFPAQTSTVGTSSILPVLSVVGVCCRIKSVQAELDCCNAAPSYSNKGPRLRVGYNLTLSYVLFLVLTTPP